MSKRSEQPDVSQLLETLRQQADRMTGRVRFQDVDLIRRISDRVATHLGRPGDEHDTPSVLQMLRRQTEAQPDQVRFDEIGIVQHVGSGVATLSGLPHARTDELVNFATGVQGLILNLDHNLIDVVLLGSEEGIRGGDLATATGERLCVPVGRRLLGRVLNPLGEPLDGHGLLGARSFRHVDRDAPGIIERAPSDQPLQTGLKIVDALVPIARGQRELIVGDRQTGKTTLAVDAIINQRESDVFCVYVAIGQKKSSTLAVIETLRANGAMPHTIVVTSSPDDPPALRYLAPYTGCTMAEFLMHQGHDALIVYDDLTKHADAYRELSLLLRRPPGREAYPGDIFYVHARLMERACKLAPVEEEGEEEERAGGSLTALPVAETKQGNIVAYIPTNLICATDMRVVFDTDLFNQGVKPAVNIGRSVSRLGGAAQTEAMRKVAGRLRLELAQFEEVSRFARFSVEVGEATQRQIRRGERLREVLTQPAHRPLSLASEIVILLAATEGYLDEIALEDIPAFERDLLAHFEGRHAELHQQINTTGELSDEAQDRLVELIARYRARWLEGKTR